MNLKKLLNLLKRKNKKMEMKVFTFNLRTEASVDGINAFHNRHDRVLGCIKEYDPDIIGFQECKSEMKAWLADVLAPLGYTLVGCGRDKDYHGEGTPVAFKRSKFELISCVTRWMSLTPTVPGSKFGFDQSACPRVFTATVLKPENGAPFMFLNTHTDHKGPVARLLAASEIMQYVSDEKIHFIITGDMNAHPGTPEIEAFTSPTPCGRPVVDATNLIPGTFHAFGKRETMSKIDYIFTDMPCDPSKSFAVPDEPVDGVYISDHRPVCAFVSTEEE